MADKRQGEADQDGRRGYQMAEVAVARQRFADRLPLIAGHGPLPAPAGRVLCGLWLGE
ncbi:MAG TPA: hypothetical protein VM715_21430 [Candidatus Acidoferrum sp.]|nr:hypothetical protein [Candidatus Acidoferrum sp.]